MTRLRILDAASRLFVDRGYGNVRMDDIAKAAGVAYQTVYSVFGTKLAVAEGVIWSSFETEGIFQLMARGRESGDLEVGIRTGAQIARRLNERFAEIVRFMRESGDPALLAEYHKIESLRFDQIRSQVTVVLEGSGRLSGLVSPAEALGVIWAMCGTDLYNQLVVVRGWTPTRYEEWLGEALVNMLLQPTSSESG